MASWRAAYKGIIDQKTLDDLNIAERTEQWRKWMTEKAFPHWTLFVAEEEGRVRGFSSCGGARGEAAKCEAEIYAIYLHPDYMGKGVGAKLFERARDKLRAHNYASFSVDVLAENRAARKFYEKQSGVINESSLRPIELYGQEYNEITYEWWEI